MDRKHNKQMAPIAKSLRKNMTKEERHLWYDFLKDYPIRFYRQKILGKYVADFYCSKAKLVIELDGGGHFNEVTAEKDKNRAFYLENHGLKVIRFCNLDIDRNFYEVCSMIDDEVKKRIHVV